MDMMSIKTIGCMTMLVMTACVSEDEVYNEITEANSRIGEIVCNTEGKGADSSRTYYEAGAPYNVYYAKWGEGDRLAICFNGEEQARQFSISDGANSMSAVFTGTVPEAYDDVMAVYPYDIYKSRTQNKIDVKLPSTICYTDKKMLCDAMPMMAHGSTGVLNFYNLTGVLEISLQGKGLLKSVTISSVDGYGLSGNGHIELDKNNIPSLTMDKSGESLTINTGAIFLSEYPLELFLPIPAATYENGLKLEFNIAGGTETRVLGSKLRFERSELRAAKPVDPYIINIPFDFDSYTPADNEIWYTSKDSQQALNEINMGSRIVTQSFDSRERLGVVTTKSTIEKITGPLFASPKSVTFVKLPETVQEIGQDAMEETFIREFVAPRSLKMLGTDAFNLCANLRRVVLNEGFESLGAEAFGGCPLIEYVYLPKTLKTISVYSFMGSTERLDHWDGDCPLIDEDRHALYSNTGYGMVSKDPTQIDVVAGCNLTSYSIPEQALYTQNYAMSGLKNLKRLIVHENFIDFGLALFVGMPELETIVCFGATPPRFDSDENFKADKLKEILVPEESVEVYKNSKGWKNFADKIKAIN